MTLQSRLTAVNPAVALVIVVAGGIGFGYAVYRRDEPPGIVYFCKAALLALVYFGVPATISAWASSMYWRDRLFCANTVSRRTFWSILKLSLRLVSTSVLFYMPIAGLWEMLLGMTSARGNGVLLFLEVYLPCSGVALALGIVPAVIAECFVCGWMYSESDTSALCGRVM